MKPIRCAEPSTKSGLVIPGRHRQVANPESIALGHWLWIPGSPHPISGLPEIGTGQCAHRQQPMCGGAPE